MRNAELTDPADAHFPFPPAKVPIWRQHESSVHHLAVSIPPFRFWMGFTREAVEPCQFSPASLVD